METGSVWKRSEGDCERSSLPEKGTSNYDLKDRPQRPALGRWGEENFLPTTAAALVGCFSYTLAPWRVLQMWLRENYCFSSPCLAECLSRFVCFFCPDNRSDGNGASGWLFPAGWIKVSLLNWLFGCVGCYLFCGGKLLTAFSPNMGRFDGCVGCLFLRIVFTSQNLAAVSEVAFLMLVSVGGSGVRKIYLNFSQGFCLVGSSVES